MSTLTPIKNLKKPQTTDTVPQTLTDLGTNFDIIDGMGISKVLSSTHPGSPAYGDVIVETNTGNVLVYYGGVTGWQPTWNTAWGILLKATDVSTNQSGITTATKVTGQSVGPYTFIANRRIKVVSRSMVSGTNGATCPGVSWVLKNGSTQLARSNFLTAGTAGIINVDVEYIFTSTAATITFDTYLGLTGAGTNTLTTALVGSSAVGTIYIEDLGPVGAPA